MKEIILTQGKKTLVDDEDYSFLSQFNWHAVKYGTKWYACCRRDRRGNKYRMHRILMRVPDDLDVDHVDGDGLNNQRANLRFATDSQNQANRQKTTAISGFKGVYRNHGLKESYRARIAVNGKHISLGSFETAEEAARVYDAAATKYFGEFAYLNFRGIP